MQKSFNERVAGRRKKKARLTYHRAGGVHLAAADSRHTSKEAVQQVGVYVAADAATNYLREHADKHQLARAYAAMSLIQSMK